MILMLKLMLIPILLISCLQASTVLITGANRGIGLEFARQYQAKGYEVIATARRPEEAKELKSLKVRVEPLDVTDPQSVSALSKKLAGHPIDLLINNAGVLLDRDSSLETLDFDDLTYSFAVNAAGPMRMSQALLPNMRAGKLKRIVHISSQMGSIQNNSGGSYTYRASKAALNQLNKTMSMELGKEGFVSVVMHPGWVRTDMGGSMATYTPEQSARAMIGVIDKFDNRSNGRFVDLHGNELPW
jgi:NAD(P)-dependent dehydrogenase (short-subunit alcohol dehydrogenase family)